MMEEEIKNVGSSITAPVPNAQTAAQGTSLRENLVDLAVKFLSNPRVMERPIEDKRAFLKKKGLTEQEISAAESMAPQQVPTASSGGAHHPPPLPPRTLTPAVPTPKPRTWSEYAVMAAVVGGVGYALVHFIKNYIIPWLSAPRVQEKKLEDIHASVGQLQSTVNETIAGLAASTKSVQELLSEQQQHIQLLTTQVAGLQASLAQQSNDKPLKQLKEELGSLKGILLSRHQFPPTPIRGGVANGGAAGIPAWQRTAPISAIEPDSTPVKLPMADQEQSPVNRELVMVNGTAEESEKRTLLQNGNGTTIENGNGPTLQHGNEDENSLDRNSTS